MAIGLANVQLIKVEPIYARSAFEKLTTNPKRQTGFSFDIKHDRLIHTITITVILQVIDENHPENLIIDLHSETVFKVTTTDNSFFALPVKDDLIRGLVNLISIAIAHNRGMYEITTHSTKLKDLQVAHISEQEIETRIRFQIEKKSHDN